MAVVPSFKGRKSASPNASRAKRANRCANTRHEQVLRSALWKLGLRYRKNVAGVLGKPDIVFPATRVAVFCDGDFWHGRSWRSLKRSLTGGSNGDYWIAKITANRARDQRVTRALENAGWQVIRLWETDVLHNPELAATTIQEIVQSRTATHAIPPRVK